MLNMAVHSPRVLVALRSPQKLLATCPGIFHSLGLSTSQRWISDAPVPGAPDGVKITMPAQSGDDRVLTPPLMQFLVEMHRRFNPQRNALLTAREAHQEDIDRGLRPGFLPETTEVRNARWEVASIPHDVQNRRVEITGPVDRKMVINALNSGANVFMADFEDSNTPIWRNQIDGQKNLYDAIRRQISYEDPKTGKAYQLSDNPAILMVRPRGWHLPEKHFLVDGQPMSGSLFDFGLYFFHNAKELLKRQTRPYIYLPKMENFREAELWNDVFLWSEERLGVPRATVRCTALIEHILASFQAEEILYELREHMLGLNAGRWDYIFSLIKVFQQDPAYVTPDRSELAMTVPFLRSYVLNLIRTCHRRGAFAMGGMAAFIPIKGDEAANEAAIAKVKADKEREVEDGHDGTWVAHPGLVQIAKSIFDRRLGPGSPNQISRQLSGHGPSAQDLIAIPTGSRTEAGMRHNVRVTLGYMEAWLRGTGCVPLFNLMEDAATAEISRAQLWQWVTHRAKLDDGTTVDQNLVDRVIKEEVKFWEGQMPSGNRVQDAADLILQMVTAPKFPRFLTLAAYDKLVAEGQ